VLVQVQGDGHSHKKKAKEMLINDKYFYKVITIPPPKLTKSQVQVQGEGRSCKKKAKEMLVNVSVKYLQHPPQNLPNPKSGSKKMVIPTKKKQKKILITFL
jgi:hypothetical protein